MPQISIVINCDTRISKDTNDGLFNGVVNEDFLSDGVWNKINFFNGFEKEVILFIDKHQEISPATLDYIHKICDVVVVRKHTNEEHFNDYNYLSALSLARGEYIAHFDQDVSAFTKSQEPINFFIDLLESYDYVSYPCIHSPLPAIDHSFDHVWASTRFFMCKRKTLDFTELRRCLEDYDYWGATYPVNRKCHWVEHLLGSISKYKGNGVFYPPPHDDYAIFTWGRYEKYTLRRLNEQSYEEVKQFIIDKGGIQYPNDVNM